MKKIVSLAALTAILAGCAGNNATNAPAGYGSDGFGEETLVTTSNDKSLNAAYLMAPAPKYYVGSAYKV